MSIKLVLCIPTLNRFEECNHLIETALRGTYKPLSIEVIDNSGNGLFTPLEDGVMITQMDSNIGVARSFNYFLDLVDEIDPNAYAVISNDDLLLYDDTLEQLAKGIERNNDQLIFCSDLQAANSFSFFAVQPARVLSRIGWFEIMFHSYLEDCDYMRRARLLGYDLFSLSQVRIKDHIGSGTIKNYTPDEMEKFHKRRAIGIAEYQRKWGALPEHGETFHTPYNSGIEVLQWHISHFAKYHPYETKIYLD